MIEIEVILCSAAGAAGIAVVGYLKRRADGVAFSLPKFIQTAGIGAIIGAVMGLSGTPITDAGVSGQVAILGTMGIGGFLTYILEGGGKYLKRSQSPQEASPAQPQGGLVPVSQTPGAGIGGIVSEVGPGGIVPGRTPGLVVTPVAQEGESPLQAIFTLHTGYDSQGWRPTIIIDWKDGSSDMVSRWNEYGRDVVSHVYQYEQGDTKYTGHQFYPEFTVVSSNGKREVFNTEQTGRSCWVLVKTPETA